MGTPTRPGTVYDGLGRCVKRTIDGTATLFTYDEWKPIAEWTGSGAFVAWNLYGPGADEILVRYQPNTGGSVHYKLDAMGNVQFLLSGELNLGLEKYTYDAFGQPRITGWNGDVRTISRYGNRFLFNGREYLYTLGIYDYRHRLYHPGLGRFIQTDPVGFGGDPMNLYRYCTGNPILHGDPTGLYSEYSLSQRDPPPLRDFSWDFAHYGDGANTKQGTFSECTNGAYDGPKSMSSKDEGKKTGHSSFFDAANAWKDKAYNMSSRTREAGTEIWQSDNNPDDYRSDPPRVGNKLKDVNDKWEHGKFLSFTVDPTRAPTGYHCAGWMYAHGWYRPEVPSADQHRAFAKGWSAYLVTPTQTGNYFKQQYNVRLYNYPDTPSNQ